MNAGYFKRLFKSKRRENGDKRFIKKCLSCSWRSPHCDVVSAGRRDFKSSFCCSLTFHIRKVHLVLARTHFKFGLRHRRHFPFLYKRTVFVRENVFFCEMRGEFPEILNSIDENVVNERGFSPV